MQGNGVFVEAGLRKFIAENFLYRDNCDGLSQGDSLLDAGLIDSTGILELVFFLEKTYGIKVADDEVVPENLDSIGKIGAYIQRKLATTAKEVSHAPRALSA